MTETLQEFVNCQGVDVRVDAARGIIRGVKLLGVESRNGRRYRPQALREAAALYEGAKVNVNHPKGSPLAARDYQDRLGSVRNVRATEGGLFGDLHYNPKHALADQLAWDAVHSPENVGFSHNVEGRTSRNGAQTVVEAITRVQSVDLVADPATTRSLYESAAAGGAAEAPARWADLTLGALRAARPDLVEASAAAVAAEAAELREQLQRLQAREARRDRRARAVELLVEYQLADPAEPDAAGGALVGELFFESLLTARDEAAMRRLVEERAATIAAARRCAAGHGRPVSREQQRSELSSGGGRGLDARSFARAIS